MNIFILVEPTPAKGYRARIGEPLALTTEGATEQEAVEKLREQINARLATGSKILQVQVPDTTNPWLRMAGVFKDDPLFDQWQADIAENRRLMDEEADGQ